MSRGLPFFIDSIFFVLLMVFLFKQIIIPLWRGRPIFPMFDFKRKHLERKLSQTLEEEDHVSLEGVLQKKRDEIRNLMERKTKTNPRRK